MDIDAYYFGTLLDQGDPKQLKGIKKQLFDEEWQEVYKYVVGFLKQYGRLPRIETVAAQKQVELEVGSEPIRYYADELKNRSIRNDLSNGLRKNVFSALDKDDVPGAFRGLKGVVAQLSRKFYSSTETGSVSLRGNVKDRAAYYRERKSLKGLLGLETPWPTLTRVTAGWQDGDVIVFTARPEIGKTWLALITAMFSTLQGRRVLFASMEMKPKKVGIRADAIGARISSDRFRRGVLTHEEEARLRTWYKRCLKDDSMGEFFAYGPADVESIVDLELKILEDKPDLVIWDSYYLASETPDWKDMAQLTRDCKRLAERVDIDIPIILVTQLRRTVKKGDKRADTADLAFTQAIVNDADIILSLFRTTDMENLNEMLVRSIKIRDGIKLKELLLRWDLDLMDFTEIYATFTGGKTGKQFDDEKKKDEK